MKASQALDVGSIPITRSFLWLLLFLAGAFCAGPLLANEAPHSPHVPPEYDFIRTLDVEGYLQRAGRAGTGAQSLRIQTRYLDPDVNAFVGLLTTFNRFNEALRVGKPADPLTSLWLWTWGADLGIVRGRHLWELDLLGGSLGDHLAFSPGLVGEHQLTHRWMFYHRTFLSLFVGDTVVDSDQGIVWMAGGRFGLSAGYRIFASQHMSRNGPRIGLIFHFQTPKIPFIFPSLG